MASAEIKKCVVCIISGICVDYCKRCKEYDTECHMSGESLPCECEFDNDCSDCQAYSERCAIAFEKIKAAGFEVPICELVNPCVFAVERIKSAWFNVLKPLATEQHKLC